MSSRFRPGLVALALCTATVSRAGVPLPPHFEVPSHVILVGSTGGVPDAAVGRFKVVVRDVFDQPVPGSHVFLELVGVPDLRLCADMADPSLTVNCTARTVRGVTNAQGEVWMTVLGSGVSGAAPTASGARFFADGVLVPQPYLRVAAADLDGVNGVTGSDIAIVLGDIGRPGYSQRSDLDGSGTVTGTDIGRLLTILGAAGSSQSCLTPCP